jgi:hypothetical protein
MFLLGDAPARPSLAGIPELPEWDTAGLLDPLVPGFTMNLHECLVVTELLFYQVTADALPPADPVRRESRPLRRQRVRVPF